MNRTQRGFTLIEMMIAIVLGIIIILGVGQIFVATRTSFSAQQGLSHVQQSGRFAMEFVGSAVRSSGDMGFSNTSSLMQAGATTSVMRDGTTTSNIYQLTNSAVAGTEITKAIDFAVPLQVYEWVGSGPGTTVALPATFTASGNINAWSPAVPQFVADRAIRGSDVVIARYVEGKTFQADTIASLAAPGIAGFGTRTACVVGQGIAIGTSDVPTTGPDYEALIAAKPKRLVAIGQQDMVVIMQAAIFSTTPYEFRSFGAVGFPGNITTPLANVCGPLGTFPPISVARIGIARVDIFYIGVNATTGEPGLWRMSFDGSPTLPFAVEELVEGVENMQILAGIALPSGSARSSNRPDQYVTGSQLLTPATLGLVGENVPAAQRRTLAARVSLLTRSEEGAAGTLNNLTYQVAGTTINPSDDRRIRQVYEQTLMLRNRQRILSGSRDTF